MKTTRNTSSHFTLMSEQDGIMTPFDHERVAEKDAFSRINPVTFDQPWRAESAAKRLIVDDGFRDHLSAILTQTNTSISVIAEVEEDRLLASQSITEDTLSRIRRAPSRVSRLADPTSHDIGPRPAIDFFQQLTGHGPLQFNFDDGKHLHDLSPREILAGLTWAELASLRHREILPDNETLFRLMHSEKSGAPLSRTIAISNTVGQNTHNLRAKDSMGRWACYFVYVPPKYEKIFLDAINGNGSVNLEDFGSVLISSYEDDFLAWYRKRQANAAWKDFAAIIEQYRNWLTTIRVSGFSAPEERESFISKRLGNALSSKGSAEALLNDLLKTPVDKAPEHSRLDLSDPPKIGWSIRFSKALGDAVYDVGEARRLDFHAMADLIRTLAGDTADNSIAISHSPGFFRPIASQLASLVAIYGGGRHAWIEVLHELVAQSRERSASELALSLGLVARRREIPKLRFRQAVIGAMPPIGLVGLSLPFISSVLGGPAGSIVGGLAMALNFPVSAPVPVSETDENNVVVTRGPKHIVQMDKRLGWIFVEIGNEPRQIINFKQVNHGLALLDIMLRIPSIHEQLISALPEIISEYDDIVTIISTQLYDICTRIKVDEITKYDQLRAIDIDNDASVFRSSYRIRELIFDFMYSPQSLYGNNRIIKQLERTVGFEEISSICVIGDAIADHSEFERKAFLRKMIARSLQPVFDQAEVVIEPNERDAIIDELTFRLSTGYRETKTALLGNGAPSAEPSDMFSSPLPPQDRVDKTIPPAPESERPIGSHTARVLAERGNDGGEQQAAPMALPDKAPVLWKDAADFWAEEQAAGRVPKDEKLTPPSFIKHVYGTLGLLREDGRGVTLNWFRHKDHDPGLYRAIYNYRQGIQRKNKIQGTQFEEWPSDCPIPTKSDAITTALSNIEISDSLQKLIEVKKKRQALK